MLDANEVGDLLQPELSGRLRGIARQLAGLQAEAAGIMRREAERLSDDERSELQARVAINEWYQRLMLASFQDEADELKRSEM